MEGLMEGHKGCVEREFGNKDDILKVMWLMWIAPAHWSPYHQLAYCQDFMSVCTWHGPHMITIEIRI